MITLLALTLFLSMASLVEAGGDYPTFSSYWDNNGTLIDSGPGMFNVTIDHGNGTAILQFNNINYTADNYDGDRYNVSIQLTGAGTYPYYWFAFSTDDLYNWTQVRYYTINSTPPLPPVIYSKYNLYPSDNMPYIKLFEKGGEDLPYVELGKSLIFI